MGKMIKIPSLLNCRKDSVGACGLSVDDSTHNRIKTDMNRVLATLPSASTHAQIGRLYSVIVNINTVDGSGLLRQILFNNTSNQTMYLDKIAFSSVVDFPLDTPFNYVQSVTITIIKNVVIIDPGEPRTPANLNTAFADESALAVSQNPNSTGGSPIFAIRPLGDYSSLDFDGRIVVPPNTNLVIQYLLHEAPNDFFLQFWSTVTWYEL